MDRTHPRRTDSSKARQLSSSGVGSKPILSSKKNGQKSKGEAKQGQPFKELTWQVQHTDTQSEDVSFWPGNEAWSITKAFMKQVPTVRLWVWPSPRKTTGFARARARGESWIIKPNIMNHTKQMSFDCLISSCSLWGSLDVLTNWSEYARVNPTCRLPKDHEGPLAAKEEHQFVQKWRRWVVQKISIAMYH